MPTHGILTVILLLAQFLIQAADSGAIVKIRFLYYSNPQGRLHDGHRCDPRIYLGKRRCDPFFTIEIKVGGQTFRQKTDRAKDENTVHFGSKIVDIANPVVNRVDHYYGHLDVSVRVDDFDSVTSNDHIGSFYHSFSAPARPFGELSAPQEIRLFDDGRSAAELALQISVHCEAHYYGSDCSKFCQPRSDPANGHYLCRSDGSKLCEPTYDSATDCRDKFCSGQPCRNGGSCIDLPNRFVCECNRLFGGDRCTERLALCQHNKPCRNGGTCHAGVGCACPPGLHGDACQLDVDECRPNSPCRGKGSVCKNFFGSYSCHCGSGWRGRNCTEDIDECAVMGYPACFNGGRCENTPGSFICHCLSGFGGQQCQEDIDECSLDGGPCLNETHVCQNLWGSFICMCQDELKGPNCTEQWPGQMEYLSDVFSWWPPVVVGTLAVLAVIALLLVLRSSNCRRRMELWVYSSKSLRDGRENASADNPVYRADCENEVDVEESTTYDEPQEAADLRIFNRNRGPELAPPLPPRSLNMVTIGTQHETVISAVDVSAQ